MPHEPYRQPVYGSAAVATSQPLAAEAGMEMLRRGGNAVDAAIATAAALTVVEPTSNGIGGDAFAMAWVPGASGVGGELHGWNGSGQSPAALERSMVGVGGVVPERGWLPVTVPGQVALWGELSRRHGRLAFSDLLEPAVRHAREGFPVSPLTAHAWARAAETLRDQPGWADTFLIGGAAPSAGEVVRLPDHARTLEAIAASGGAELYTGELARRIAECASDAGAPLAAEDLAEHRTLRVTPLHTQYRGVRVHQLPPNGQGIATLVALAVLERFDLRTLEPEGPESIHLQIEAMKLGFADAHAHVADSAWLPGDTEALLHPHRIDDLAASIDPFRAKPLCRGTPRPGGTVYLCTADADGGMVSFIQSNYMGWGSGIVVPGTGIALQNRGACFTPEISHPNSVGPRKRPYHTIMPGFVTRAATGGRIDPVMAFGVMGGFMQPQGQLQVASRIFDHGLDPQAALDAPRWQWTRGMSVMLEPGFPPSLADRLRGMGHDVEVADSRSVTFGRGQAIRRLSATSPTLVCGSDHRADGTALVR
jgi:gamma-glutamyltranspeptidase/glutathione hydrolase